MPCKHRLVHYYTTGQDLFLYAKYTLNEYFLSDDPYTRVGTDRWTDKNCQTIALILRLCFVARVKIAAWYRGGANTKNTQCTDTQNGQLSITRPLICKPSESSTTLDNHIPRPLPCFSVIRETGDEANLR